MANREIYSLDLNISVNGDGAAKTKLKATERFMQQTEKRAKLLDKLKISPAVRVVDRASSTIDRISRKSRLLNKVIRTTATVVDRSSNVLDRIRNKSVLFSKPINAIINAKDKTSDAIGKVKAKVQNLAAATVISLNMKADPALRAIALTRTKLGELTNKLSAFGGKTYQAIVKLKENVSPTLQSLDGKINSFVKGVVTKFATITTAGALAFGGIGLGSSIKTFADFEKGLSNVKAVTGATNAEMKQLSDTALDLGATTAWSAVEVTQAEELLGQAGFTVKETISALPGLLNLASAGGLELASATDIAVGALKSFNLNASDSGHVADVLALSASATNSDVTDLGETLKYVAPVAQSLGISFEDTAAAAGLLSNANIKGSQAGTILRQTMARLASPTKEAAGVMKKYGINAFDAQGNMKPLSTLVDDLNASLKGLTSQQKADVISTIFGTESMSGVLALMNQGGQSLGDLSKKLSDSKGAAEEMANIKLDNLWGQFEELGGAIDTMKINLGKKLAPYTKDFAQWLISKVPQVGDTIVQVVDTIISKMPEALNKLKEFAPVIAGLTASLITFKSIMTGIAVITTIGPIISNIVSAIALFAGGAGTLAEAMLLVMGPIGWIITGVGLLVGALVLAYQKSEIFRNKVNELGQKIMEFIGPVIDVAKEKLTELGTKFMELLGRIAPLGIALLELGVSIINGLSPIIGFIGSIFVSGLVGAFSLIVSAVSAAMSVISGILGGLASIISGLVNLVSGIFAGSWAQAFQGAQSIVSGVVSVISGLWQGLVSLLTAPVQAVVDILDSAFKSKASGIKKTWESIKSFLSHPIQGVVNIVQSIVGGGKSEKKSNTKHATGGIFTTPHYALFAEEAGGEAVIPLNGKRRDRAISLWQETGEKLGMVNKDRYRNAGNQSSYFTTGDRSRFEPKDIPGEPNPTGDNDTGGPTFPVYTPNAGNSNAPIIVNVDVNNNFDGDIDEESVIQAANTEFSKKLRSALKNIKK